MRTSMAEGKISPLLHNLIHIATQISEIPTFKCVIKKQCLHLTRRIRFLSPLFQEILDLPHPLPYDAVLALISLNEALAKAKELLHFCSIGSQLFMIMERDQIKCKFVDLAVHFEEAISKISCDKLDISDEVKEQVALVTAQFRRAKEHFDPPDLQLYENLVSIYKQRYDVNTQLAKLQVICEKLQFTNVEDVKQESLAVHKMFTDRGGIFVICTQIQKVLKKIENFMQIESANIMAFLSEDPLPCTDEPYKNLSSLPLVIPDEFRCPISLELMKDPVIICTGQTYERTCIKKWLEAGHGTCPKTRQILTSSALIPNHVLYSLISNWCESNGVEPPKRLGNLRLYQATSDGSSKFVDLDTLVSKLASSKIEDQRCAAGDLRLLAKHNSQNRMLIGEAGAIPLLVDLLYVRDAGTQEHAVTALLNLSIYDDNKERIMASEAVPGILHVLKNGSMVARENAAATFFSLSAKDVNKVAIGASGAIQELVTLLCNGSRQGKDDAAKALFKLCFYQGNKGRAVRAGIVPKLIELLTEQGGEMKDEALAIMGVIVSHREGKTAIGSMNVMPILVELVSNGSPTNKENAASVLVHLCSGDPMQVSVVSSLEVTNSLMELAKSGSERGKRKATQLLELIGIQNPLSIC